MGYHVPLLDRAIGLDIYDVSHMVLSHVHREGNRSLLAVVSAEGILRTTR